MAMIAKVLLGVAVVAFALAVISALTGRIMNIQPEGYSRACNNLALIAIGLGFLFRPKQASS